MVVAVTLAVALALALLSVPKFATFGVESALVLGLSLPPLSGALALYRSRHLSPATGLGDRLSAVFYTGMAPLHGAGAVQLCALLWVPICEPGEGFLFFLLGPGVGCALACLCGVIVAAAMPSQMQARGKNWAPAMGYGLVTAIPFAALLLGIAGFFFTPAIYVFGHFAGWFPGTLYDVGTSVPTRYWTFRLTTLLLAVGLTALLSSCWTHDARVSLRAAAGKPKRAVFGIAALSCLAFAHAFGGELGHRSSSQSIAEALGRTIESERCILVIPMELPVAERERLARDCDFRVVQAEQFLGVREPHPIRAYFFRSAQEKQFLMGARDTFIAKPWLGEVYLQHRPWPHPVLAHEIAHVVARNTASGPLGLGGQLGGFLPDGGLIEGLAVATAWTTPSHLTPHQWSRALLELDRLPSLQSMFGLSFLSLPSRGAYTSAGSFLRFVHTRFGGKALRRAYRTGSLQDATGLTETELEQAWHRFLNGVELPADTLPLAQLRFSGRGFFSAVCPHKVAKLKRALLLSSAAGDQVEVTETCQAILQIDPADIGARIELLGQQRVRSADEAIKQATAAQELGVPPAATPALLLRWADEAWRRDDVATARQLLRRILEMPLEEDTRRSVEVRSIGIRAPEPQRAALFALLVGPTRQGTPAALAVFEAQQLTEVRDDGLGPYLLARQLWFAGANHEAATTLGDAFARGLPTESIEREARRLYVKILVAGGQLLAAKAWLAEWPAAPGDLAMTAFVDEWKRRVAWEQAHAPRQ